ncbi:MAG TPA: two pore domain potassium channel family protein [Bacteroidales bacterium]|nr:two pore domain potassium channel family protein [Bacteroidales bacterium]
MSFFEAQLGKLIFSDCQFNSTVNLHVKQSGEISVAGCTIRDIVEFYTHGYPPSISSLNLAGVRLLGQIYIDWDANGVRNLIYSQGCSTVDEKAEQFRILKENFNALGKYDEEDAAYVEFKRCHMKALLLNSNKQGRMGHIINRVIYGVKKLLFDYMGLFATSPQRVILSILVVYVVYSLLYIAIMGLGWGHITATSASGDQLGVVARGLYFSVVTFFTIGYGDFAPSGIARFVAGTEGFMGVFLMAYFTVAFVRKILR